MLKAFAWAKINLSLDILAKRADGYHELEMVLQMISLCDTLLFSPAVAGEITLSCSDSTLPTGPENLVVRAACALREAVANEKLGVSINLIKRIPSGAGLAGGSSDAAATLRALNQFWELELDLPELMAIAQTIGSDVPFCLQGGTALATGTGVCLTPLASPPPIWLVLVKPTISISTPWAYQAYDEWLSGKAAVRRFTPQVVEAIQRGDWQEISASLGNALEAPVLERYPLIGNLKKMLLAAGAYGTSMTGSGSCVYGVFGTEAAARAAADCIAREWAETAPLFIEVCQTRAQAD